MVVLTFMLSGEGGGGGHRGGGVYKIITLTSQNIDSIAQIESRLSKPDQTKVPQYKDFSHLFNEF